MEKISSACIYCGVGCGLNYIVENDATIKVEPVKEDVVSEGAAGLESGLRQTPRL